MSTKEKAKKGVLTLETLATYDDVSTDALVDNLYYWTTIRKNSYSRFTGSRGLQPDAVADIVRTAIIIEKNPVKAVEQLLELAGLRKFVATLPDDKERQHFTRHLTRYVKIYMADCPFEVTTTNRYTISDHEAAIAARREIKAREEIKYLTGVQVAMTDEQETNLVLARKDFSLVVSSRKNTRSLFLGPARFANHDCNANARLVTKGYGGMQVYAVKDIAVGEEITVSYGTDYFGEGNVECLCQSCEKQYANGWAPFKQPDDDDDDEDCEEEEKADPPVPEEIAASKNVPQEDTPKSNISQEDTLPDDCGYSLRNKRKRGSDDSTCPSKKSKSEVDNTSKPESVGSASSSKKSKTKDKIDTASKKGAGPEIPATTPTTRRILRPLRETTLKKTHEISSRMPDILSSPRHELLNKMEDVPSSFASSKTSREIRTQQRVGMLSMTLDETASPSPPTTPGTLTVADSPGSFLSTDATSVDCDTPMVDPEQNIDENLQNVARSNLGVSTVKIEQSTSVFTPILDGKPHALNEPGPMANPDLDDLSELGSDYELDDTRREVVKRKRPKPLPTMRVTRATRSVSRYAEIIGIPLDVNPLEAGLVPNNRKPGDYVFSDTLLSAKYSKWAECHNCDDYFIHKDSGNRTRKDCPRCERHSMLYGFVWPKTDKEGKYDREERVLDPRTVDRYVDPKEEVTIKLLQKTLKERMARRYSTPRHSTPRSSVRSSSSSTNNPRSVRKPKRKADEDTVYTGKSTEDPRPKRKMRKTM